MYMCNIYSRSSYSMGSYNIDSYNATKKIVVVFICVKQHLIIH